MLHQWNNYRPKLFKKPKLETYSPHPLNNKEIHIFA